MTTHALPRLAVVFDDRSVDVSRLAAASRDTWQTVWLIDDEYPVAASIRRLIGRFGPVVDVTGMPPAEVVRAIGEPVDGLAVLNEVRLADAAELAPHLGVDFLSPRAVVNLTDKDAQRAALRAGGLPTPASVRVPAGCDAQDAAAAASALSFPVVIKPVHGRSSRQTVPARSLEEVALFVAGLGDRLEEDFVVEERIPDQWAPHERPYSDYVSVESFACRGGFAHFAVTGRPPLASGFRESGMVMPAVVPRDEWPALCEVAEAAVLAMGARTGAFHTEIKLAPDGPRVIEVNGRIGGGPTTWLAERVGGQNLLGAVARVALGLPLTFDEQRFDGVGFEHLELPPEDARRVVSVDGLDALRRLPGVEEVDVAKRAGAAVDPRAEGTNGFVYVVRGRVNDHDELWTLLDTIRTVAPVTYGEDDRATDHREGNGDE